jgi:hypothetical protein
MPLCGECRFGPRRETVMMRRTVGQRTLVKDAPNLPEGLLPFESTVLRAMRRLRVRAADHERDRIVAYIRRQKAASWPDLRDLAEAIRHGEHHHTSRSNVYLRDVAEPGKDSKTGD